MPLPGTNFSHRGEICTNIVPSTPYAAAYDESMDILAHGLWAGLGVRWLARRRTVTRAQGVAAVSMSVLPDVVHLLPLVAWAAFGAGSAGVLIEYAFAVPGAEPAMPAWVSASSHHLHCILHSALIASGVTALLWRWRERFGVVLAGWWLHIGIDVLTHSREFYPVPVLYPLTQQGFDGLAWNTPWFMVLNYAALALAAWWLWRRDRVR